MTWWKEGGSDMVIVRTPLRLEFLGGSTDIENYYSRAMGRVLNVTLDKYIYIFLKRGFDGKIKVVYDRIEEVDAVEKLEHKHVRGALEMLGINEGIEIGSVSDIPGGGTGLGSSSSFTVGLLSGLMALNGKRPSKKWLAEMACHLEIDVLGEPIGKQDQYAAVFGDLCATTFEKGGKVTVNNLKVSPEFKHRLENYLMAFYTGATRSTSNILRAQHQKFEEKFPLLQKMANLVVPAYEALEKEDVKEFAQILYEEWTTKKKLMPGITTPEIEEMYNKAGEAGAWGGRISGAGGGGFLYVFAPIERQEKIREALSDYKYVPMRFSSEGSKIIYRQD